MSKTTIEWSEHTWNPTGGCFKVSPGCKNCYAIRVARRLGGNPNNDVRAHYDGLTVIQGGQMNWSGEVTLNERVLLEPLKRKQPTTYFISLSDLFYDKRHITHIHKVLAVISQSPQHTFQVLTKYADRMQQIMSNPDIEDRVDEEGVDLGWCHANAAGRFPLPNLHLGVSVENQQYADERTPLLLKTPAAVRFVSYEPALGPVDFERIANDGLAEGQRYIHALKGYTWETHGTDYYDTCGIGAQVDWIIVGGESGPGARPFDIEWARNTIAQCKAAGVPVFCKQMGAKPIDSKDGILYCANEPHAQKCNAVTLKDKKGGDMAEWPEDLRVRELPQVVNHGTHA
jgi:protein gp37